MVSQRFEIGCCKHGSALHPWNGGVAMLDVSYTGHSHAGYFQGTHLLAMLAGQPVLSEMRFVIQGQCSCGDSLFCLLSHKMVSMANTKHIYLTGFRGTGKTSVGSLLARSLGRTVIDLDGVVTANAGKSISEIFQDGGEVAFRELESNALESVAQTENAVISLGGGAILRAGNRAIIRSTGVCVWLDCDAETIARRLQQDDVSLEQRPALTTLDELQEIRELLQARHPLYLEAADHRLDTDGRTIEQVAEQIMQWLTENASV
ncbi:MAG: shikimate kinase [Rubripirellula sp.]